MAKYKKSVTKFVSKKRVGTTIDSNILEQDFSTVLKAPQNGLIRKDNVLMQYLENEQSKSGRRKYSKLVRQAGQGQNGQSTINEKAQKEHSALKNRYTSFKDFAYYGSANELVKATVVDIAKRFPGALYWPTKDSPSITVTDENDNSHTLLELSNEFGIDCWSTIKTDEIKSNIMRGLLFSHDNYEGLDNFELKAKFMDGSAIDTLDGHLCPDSIIGKTNLGILGDDESTWPFIYCDGEYGIHLLIDSAVLDDAEDDHSTTIGYGMPIAVPKKEIIDEFWETLDDFESVLLNRITNPMYSAKFDVPYFTEENGFKYKTVEFIWPKVKERDLTSSSEAYKDSYCVLISGPFEDYMSSLVNAAMEYDESDTDNIWRMMTHDSIKNLDSSVFKDKDSETQIDNTKVQSILRLYGREFDDIKRCVDNIKYKNALKYDDNNSSPRELLKKYVEYNGWRNKSVASTSDIYNGTEIKTKKDSFDGISDGLYPSEVNDEFMKRLALSSSYIQSLKGTVKGVEAILGMFGYKKIDSEDEFTEEGQYKINEYISVASNFMTKDDFLSLRTYWQYTDDVTDGYPVAIDYDADKIVPWVKPGVKYDNNLYFQEKGGWGKTGVKEVYIDGAIEPETLNKIALYRETVPNIYYVANRYELLTLGSEREVYNNTVCHVADLSTFSEIEVPANGSNYFILYNKDLYDIIGNNIYSSNNYPTTEKGWVNVNMGDLTTIDAQKVLYAESVIFDSDGNNPHDGNGEYDDGSSYIKKFNHLFLDGIKNGNYSSDLRCSDKKFFKALVYSGFCLTSAIDNKKCHYFSEDEENPWDNCNYWDENEQDFYDTINNPIDDVDGFNVHAANSVVNLKNIKIEFNCENEFLKNYIKSVVLNYVEDMLPSTAIVSYQFTGEHVFVFGSDSDEFCETIGVNQSNGGQAFVTGEFVDSTAIDLSDNSNEENS